MPSPLSATLTLTINQFRALGGIFPINATLAITEQPSPSIITLAGKSITVSVPQGTPVELTFSLPNQNYILLGIALNANTPTPTLGLTEFPTVNITRSPAGSSMVVTDAGSNQTRYNYLILVQSVATGDIGVIDPGIENESGD